MNEDAGTEAATSPTAPRERRVEVSIFFPPAPPRQPDDVDDDGTDDGLKVPAPLREYFAFASENAAVARGAERVLESSFRIASFPPYDGETVLTRISQVVNGDATDQ